MQPCIEQPPPSPPRAKTVTVYLNGDGGTTGCTAAGDCPGCKPGATLTVTTGQCAVATSLGDLSVSKNNGWNDGGAP